MFIFLSVCSLLVPLSMIILPEKQKSCTITCVRIIFPRHLKIYRVLFMK